MYLINKSYLIALRALFLTDHNLSLFRQENITQDEIDREIKIVNRAYEERVQELQLKKDFIDMYTTALRDNLKEDKGET